MFVKQNAGNTNVICVTLAGHVEGKKMTVFEKIKEMDIDELAKFLDETQGEYDYIENLYCGFICEKSNSSDYCCDYPESCVLNGEPFLACKAFLNSDYDKVRSIKYGKE